MRHGPQEDSLNRHLLFLLFLGTEDIKFSVGKNWLIGKRI